MIQVVQFINEGNINRPFITGDFNQAATYFIELCEDRGIAVPVPITPSGVAGIVQWARNHTQNDGTWEIKWWMYDVPGLNGPQNQNLDRGCELLKEVIAYPDQTTDKRVYKFLREINRVDAGFRPMFLEDGETLNADGFWEETQ